MGVDGADVQRPAGPVQGLRPGRRPDRSRPSRRRRRRRCRSGSPPAVRWWPTGRPRQLARPRWQPCAPGRPGGSHPRGRWRPGPRPGPARRSTHTRPGPCRSGPARAAAGRWPPATGPRPPGGPGPRARSASARRRVPGCRPAPARSGRSDPARGWWCPRPGTCSATPARYLSTARSARPTRAARWLRTLAGVAAPMMPGAWRAASRVRIAAATACCGSLFMAASLGSARGARVGLRWPRAERRPPRGPRGWRARPSWWPPSHRGWPPPPTRRWPHLGRAGTPPGGRRCGRRRPPGRVPAGCPSPGLGWVARPAAPSRRPPGPGPLP